MFVEQDDPPAGVVDLLLQVLRHLVGIGVMQVLRLDVPEDEREPLLCGRGLAVRVELTERRAEDRGAHAHRALDRRHATLDLPQHVAVRDADEALVVVGVRADEVADSLMCRATSRARVARSEVPSR